MQPASLALGLCLLFCLLNLLSLGIAFFRVSRRSNAAVPADPPPVSIVIPMRGVEAFSEITIEHAFSLSWPRYELLFCVAEQSDPIVRLVEAAMKRHPHVAARLLAGDDRISANPKLNNCAKGWRAARHGWVILADSNVLMPPDYIARLMAAWRPDTGLVCSMPLGSHPRGFWAEVECAWLNTFQARWQYVAEALGKGFAQGKTMLWNKPLLDANGGIEALAVEIAEDAASTKLVNALCLDVHLVDTPFEQPLGHRAFSEIWSRQARWARLRRVTFPLQFAPEALAGAVPAMLLATLAAHLSDSGGLAALAGIIAVAAIYYVPEYALARAKGWPCGARYIPAMIARDLMLPAVWLRGWFGSNIEWRGNAMTIRPHEQRLEEAVQNG